MRKHQSGKSVYRVDVYVNEGQAKIIEQEVTELKKEAAKFGERKAYSSYFMSIWNQCRECKLRTGLSIRQLIDEYLRLKELRLKELNIKKLGES